MEKTSKVTSVASNGTFNSQYGMLYKFEVNFENGDSGEYASKSQDQTKFVNGQEATYTITSKQWNDRTFYTIKPAMAQASSGGGGFASKPKDPETEKRITRMSVLKASIDLVTNGNIELRQALAYAKIFEAYVIDGTDLLSTQKTTQPDAFKSMGLTSPLDDDLPF
jgi:hypothetical protein